MKDQAAKLRALIGKRQPGADSAGSPAGQARTGRRQARAASRSASSTRFISVTSGKGGVGKTNLAINLAILAARERAQRVVVLDVDLGLANVNLLLDVAPRRTLTHVVDGRASILEAICSTPYGVDILGGASGIARIADIGHAERMRLIDGFVQLEQRYDLVFIDTGAGISANVMALALAADETIVVATPEPTSITDAYAAIKTLVRSESCGVIHLVVNRARSSDEGVRVTKILTKAAADFLDVTVLPLGQVLDDPAVGQAVRRRRPFVMEYPRCAATSGLRLVTQKLLKGGARQPARTTLGDATTSSQGGAATGSMFLSRMLDMCEEGDGGDREAD